jgi:hypothetical protein
MKQITLVVILATLSLLASAQRPRSPRTLGWDLTYASLLDRNQIGHGEWIRKWLGPKYQSPVKALISGWKGSPIQSSILIEAPAPHAGERYTMWLVRTKENAYHWEFVEGRPPYNVKEPMKPQQYDDLYATLSSWQQGEPTKPENTPTGGVPGYMGFLNLYDRGSSRQMLLTQEDFWICETNDCESAKPGRLSLALETLLQK